MDSGLRSATTLLGTLAALCLSLLLSPHPRAIISASSCYIPHCQGQSSSSGATDTSSVIGIGFVSHVEGPSPELCEPLPSS